MENHHILALDYISLSFDHLIVRLIVWSPSVETGTICTVPNSEKDKLSQDQKWDKRQEKSFSLLVRPAIKRLFAVPS